MDVVRILPHARKIVIVVAKTALSVSLCAALGFHIHKAWDNGYFRYKIRQLNRIMPASFNSLVKLEQTQIADLPSLASYVYFYEQVVKYFPEQAEPWGMLGFCQYYSGDSTGARESFENALERHGDFFWFYYDLAIMDYRAGRYQEAAQLLTHALNLDPQKTINYIRGSNVIYRTIMMDAQISLVDIARRLEGGYHNAQVLLKVIQEHLNGPRKEPIKIAVRIF